MMSGMNMPLLADPGGPPVVWEPVVDRQIVNQATVDLVWQGDFDAVIVDWSNVKPVSDNVYPALRLSGDGGATFDSGASDYWFRSHYWHTTQTTSGNAGSEVTLSRIGAVVQAGNNVNEWHRARMLIARPFDATTKTQAILRGGYEDTTPSIHSFMTFMQRDMAKRTDGVQFRYQSGNVSEGRFIVYGLRAQ